MGNCLKSNKVEPFDVTRHSTERIQRGSPDKRPAKSKQADMIQSLMDEGKSPNVAKDGLSFVVDFSHGTKKGKKGKKPPNIGKKVSATESGTATDPDMPEYSAEEKGLMAEIMREDILKEKKEKARNVDTKILDAKRKRMKLAAQTGATGKEEQEKILKADTSREGKLKTKKGKARQAELEAFDVEMRKLLQEAENEAEGITKEGHEKILKAETSREGKLKTKKGKARQAELEAFDAEMTKLLQEAENEAEGITKEGQKKILKAEAARDEKLKVKKYKARQADLEAFDVEMRKLLEEAENEVEGIPKERKPVEGEGSAGETTASVN